MNTAQAFRALSNHIDIKTAVWNAMEKWRTLNSSNSKIECEWVRNRKRKTVSGWIQRNVYNFSVFPAVVCVNAFEKKWVEIEIFCYFWFSFKNYCKFILKFMIKSQFKWFGKRWQWIPCESFWFYCVNCSIKKYVVSQHKFFFSSSTTAIAVAAAAVLSSSSSSFFLSLSLWIHCCFSCCVFFLRITTYFYCTHIKSFAPFVRGSSLNSSVCLLQRQNVKTHFLFSNFLCFKWNSSSTRFFLKKCAFWLKQSNYNYNNNKSSIDDNHEMKIKEKKINLNLHKKS